MTTHLYALAAATVGLLAPIASAQAIDPASKQALLVALDAERKSEAQYRAAMKKFGPVLPYAHVADAEVQHQRAIVNLMARHRVSVPPNPWVRRNLQVPSTLDEAARRDAAGERAYASDLQRFVSMLREPEITSLFARLAQVNVERHAVAFDRAAQGLPCDGQGSGNGQGQMNRRQQGQGQGMGACGGGGACDGTGPKGMGNRARNGAGGARGRGNGRGGRGWGRGGPNALRSDRQRAVYAVRRASGNYLLVGDLAEAELRRIGDSLP